MGSSLSCSKTSTRDDIPVIISGNKRLKSITFKVHKNDGMNDYIIEMNLSKSSSKLLRKPEFILILDTSGSMKEYIPNPVSTVIIEALNKLGYEPNDYIHLITFDNKNEEKSKKIPVKDLQNERVCGNPDTYMAGVCSKIKSILKENNNRNFRILILSDGKIYDQKDTKDKAEKLKKYIEENNYIISVGSIRYNTDPSKQPDTRAIASFLRLDTYNSLSNFLTEVSWNDSNKEKSEKIYEIFKDDYFSSDFQIESASIKFSFFPWQEGRNNIKLIEGRNIIFANKNPSKIEAFIIENGEKICSKKNFKDEEDLDFDNYNKIIGPKVGVILTKVKINKISESREALKENEIILRYFKKFEESLKGNTNKETLITREIGLIEGLDISRFDENKLAKFIGVDNERTKISDFIDNSNRNIPLLTNNLLIDGLNSDEDKKYEVGKKESYERDFDELFNKIFVEVREFERKFLNDELNKS